MWALARSRLYIKHLVGPSCFSKRCWASVTAAPGAPASAAGPADECGRIGTDMLKTDVLIVGGGPVGLMAGLLLARWGVRSVIAERHERPTDHPQAHLINHRTMEVFRAVPGLSRRVSALVPPLSQWRSFIYCNAMTGPLLGAVDHFQGQSTPYLPHLSPEPVAHLSQHKLTPLLWQAVAADPCVTLLPGRDAVQIVPDEGVGVEAVVRDAVAGRLPVRVRARFAVAADGASSPTRRALGIQLQGSRDIQSLINIHFTSRELGQRLRGMEGMLYFVFSRETIAVVVAHNIDEGEFVAQVPYFPPLQSPELFTPDVCRRLVQTAAVGPGGAPLGDLEIKTVRPWTMSGLVAATYATADRRVFLVGDAAHQFPPSGAFGMNTGIQDAHNLAWKLAAVLRGEGGPSLPDSYTAERRPVAIANVQLSVQNFYEALKIPRLMGLDYHAASLVQDVLSAPAVRWLPETLRRTALETAFDLGRTAVPALSTLHKDDIQGVLSRGESLRLQYPKEDLGFQYRGAGTALYRQAPDDAEADEAARPRPRNAPYEPTILVGGRLPHAPIATVLQRGWLPAEKAEALVSTIDLALVVPGDSPTLLLLLLPGSDTRSRLHWLEAAAEVSAGWRLPLLPVVVEAVDGSSLGKTDDDPPSSGSNNPVLRLELGQEGQRWAWGAHALLIRPDGHIGARWIEPVETVGAARTELTRARLGIMKLL